MTKTHSLQNAFATFSAVVSRIAKNRHSFEKPSTMTRMYKFPLRDLGSGPKRSSATLSRAARLRESVKGIVRFRRAIRSLAHEEHCRTLW